MLLIAFSFNLGGYYLLFSGLIVRSDQRLSARLDADSYSMEEAFEIKMPLAVPYASDQESFQRVDGRFEYNGDYYRIVKQRLKKDTLTIVLVKDYQAKDLASARKHFTKLTHEPVSGEKRSSNGILKGMSEFELLPWARVAEAKPWSRTLSFGSHFPHIPSSFYPDIHLPPKIAV